MRVSYSTGYYVPLPAGHPFPMGKFPALHRLLFEEDLLTPAQVVDPRAADWADLLLGHTSEYHPAWPMARWTGRPSVAWDFPGQSI